YPPDSPPRITSVNLSSSGLNGDISPSFVNLKTVQYLDLSNNNLTGSIPDGLSQLPSLTFLDVSGNRLNGSIPSGLLKRIRDDSLDLRYGNNPNLCTNANSCQIPAKRNNKLAIYIVVPAVLIAVIVSVTLLLICLLKRKKQGSMNNSITPRNETMTTNAPGNNVFTDSSLQHLENRRFTYKDLEKITNNFQRVLGRGGFGYVYDGFLEDGTQVAVKLRSHSSHQGVKEFLAEAQILTQIHHKNLVSMIGYCKDGEYMALVYEYMSEGTLQEHIDVGSNCNTPHLSWTERLRIALESAQGLEYLHKGCNPPLIHRDVKATNILLNARLEARIADFGLSRAFDDSNDTHVSTNTLVGTPGYVDPEYQATMQPTTKSDVYSFIVVLLELVTGKAAILREPVPMSITQWARERLAQGNIEDVVDSQMLGDYDVNSVWKVADIALKCTSQMSTRRHHDPTMTDVVMQLQECIELEKAHGGGDIASHRFYSGSSSENPNLRYDAYTTNQSTNVIQNNNTFEMEHYLKRVPTMATGPSAR
ncbi:LOW QUALITY PROTEIN: receptor-like protein kinase At3g21340, partial [Triticum urartu]|uniref:LOW QUALITY PROTEIN: receptor-like protein kinase At3g21340 n=1 Tax=Triticum urartu TaxID=4572 RepID=UPI002043D55B